LLKKIKIEEEEEEEYMFSPCPLTSHMSTRNLEFHLEWKITSSNSNKNKYHGMVISINGTARLTQ